MVPTVVITISGLILLFLGLGKNKALLAPVAISGLLIALVCTFLAPGEDMPILSGMVLFDEYARLFNASMIVITLLLFLLGHEYYHDMDINVAENYTLMLFALVGAFMMTSFTSLVMLFIGIEVLSIPLYVLSGSKRHSLRSNEASFKYFLLGSFATAIFLFGITLIYGSTASFNMDDIRLFIQSHPDQLPMFFKTGMTLMMIGISFKIAAVPFHFWSPDVYEGSPTLVTSFMATVVKMAGFAAFYRLLQQAFSSLPASMENFLVIITVLTLLVGNFSALWQVSFKRLMAYSSIANTGFLLLAVLAFDPLSANTIWYYSFTYALATLVSFSLLFSVKKASKGMEQTEMFRGLWKQQPFLAIILILALFSLAGIPPLAGFFAKYFVFLQAITNGFIWISIFAILMALLGLYYYVSVFRYIFSEPMMERDLKVPATTAFVLVISCMILLFLGIFPPELL